MSRSLIILVCLLTVSLAGCGNTRYSQMGAGEGPGAAAAAAAGEAETSAYALRSDDKLAVQFFYNPELNQTAVIGRDGKIGLQLVGEIEAAGLYPQELETVIAEKYATILRQPEVTVSVDEYAPRLFYIFGEVNSPGGYPHELGMTVVNAVALAGGFTYRANTSEVQITRERDPAREPQRADRRARVLPGDVVEVPERFF